jgi:hypothetical protein
MILGWIILSFVIGFVGSGRKIGFWGAFFLSLLLSPIIGLIITLVSKNKDDEVYKKEVLETQKSQEEALNKIIKSKESESSKKSVADELEKLKKLKEENSITGEEYEKLKNKLINS